MRKSPDPMRNFADPPTAEAADQRRLIMVFLLIALGLDLIGLAALDDRRSIAIAWLFAVLILISLLLAARDILLPGRLVTPIVGFALITYFLYRNGIHDELVGAYYLTLVVAALLFGVRGLAVAGILEAAALLAIGLRGPGSPPPANAFGVLLAAFQVLAATVGLYFLIQRQNRLTEQARRNERAQVEANRELRELKLVLKRRVRERTQELDFANRQLQAQLDRVGSLQARLRHQATRDPLTGLFNRRYLDEFMDIEFDRARRQNTPVTVLMADIDHFKRINDTYGHAVGDDVLLSVSEVLTSGIRAGDIVCRYGGEELLVVMPGMPKPKAVERAERFRAQVEERTVGPVTDSRQTTISIGVAVFPEDGQRQDELLQAADEALYRAKANGRNRVELA